MDRTQRAWPRSKASSNEILLTSMENAYRAAISDFAVHLAEHKIKLPDDIEHQMTGLHRDDLWKFDHRDELDAMKKSGGRGEKKVTPKKPEETADLATAEFNPSFCKARRWNKADAGTLSPDEPGHGMQCWCDAEDDGFCKKCSDRLEDDDAQDWGVYNEPLKDSPGQKKDGKPHPWPAMKKLKSQEASEKKKTLVEKLKKKAEAKALKKAEEKAAKEAKKAEEKAAKKAEEKAAKIAAKAEAEAKAKAEADNSDTEDMEEAAGVFPEGDELGEDVSEVEEYEFEGYTMIWDRKTNELKDPDDGEVLGIMIKDENGEWAAELEKGTDSGSDEEEE